MEESSIHATELTRVGFLVFNMMDTNKLMKVLPCCYSHFTTSTLDHTVQVHVYETWNFSGDPTESDEMRPQWFSEDQIPLSQMWPDDEHWLPLLLQGKKFLGRSLSTFDLPPIFDHCCAVQIRFH
jgi:hypothetical protein